jgi:hypothetical protein
VLEKCGSCGSAAPAGPAEARKAFQEGFLLAAAGQPSQTLQEIGGFIAGKEKPLASEGIHQRAVKQWLLLPQRIIPVNAYPGQKK